MKKLLSIAEHSDILHNTELMSMSERWKLHRERVEFGRQKPELWMFMPCKLVDGAWVVLEEPNYKANELQLQDEWKDYLEAKERVIFEGFEYEKKSKMIVSNDFGMDSEDLYLLTIEDLVKYNLILK